jgi:hypothetical protein
MVAGCRMRFEAIISDVLRMAHHQKFASGAKFTSGQLAGGCPQTMASYHLLAVPDTHFVGRVPDASRNTGQCQM